MANVINFDAARQAGPAAAASDHDEAERVRLVGMGLANARRKIEAWRNVGGGGDGGNDQALIAAETEIARLSAWGAEREDAPDSVRESAYAEMREINQFIACTAPATLVGAAVKMRRLLDRAVGIDSSGDHDITSLLQVLALVHTFIGEPVHPTMPLYSAGDDAESEPSPGGAA
jgi:hypothetical protein